MQSDLRVAARTLTLDLATDEVVRGLADAVIDCMVLKGPAMTRRLYGDVPGCRNYGDIELLVAPRHFDASCLVLASSGFEDQLAETPASQATLLRNPLEDLQRALELFDDEVWRQAADLAGSVGAGAAFAADLHRQNADADLDARLGLTATDPVTWFRATTLTRGASFLSIVEPGTWAERVQRLWDVTFPSRTRLARSRPIAARGPAGLAIARLGRLWVIVTRLPRLHAWLDGDRVDPGFVELCRFPAVTPRPDLLRRGA